LLRDDGGRVWQRSVGPWSVGRELRRRSRPQRWGRVFCSAVRPRNPSRAPGRSGGRAPEGARTMDLRAVHW